MIAALGLGANDGVFFAAGKESQAAKLAGLARTRVGETLDLIDKDRFDLCWIVDFPFYEYDEDTKSVDFAHNPFSTPINMTWSATGSKSHRGRSATSRPN